MSTGRVPVPYVNDVKEDDSLMEYVPFPTMDIGSRRSGMPMNASMGPKSIEHVGGTEAKRTPVNRKLSKGR